MGLPCLRASRSQAFVTFLLLLWTPRKTAKENLAQTSSTITENLMGISRVMSQQVQQSEEAMQTLGNAGLEGKLLPGPGTCPRPLRPALPTMPALPTAPSCFCIDLRSPAGMAPQIRWCQPLSSMNGSISHASHARCPHNSRLPSVAVR